MYLIFKEAINNALRHSGCTHVHAQFSIESRTARLRITDNGCGIALGGKESGGTRGHGLNSITARAKELGGTLDFCSKPEGGTEILLRVPLGGRLWKGTRTT